MCLHQKCENIDKMARLHQSRAIYGKIKEITGQDRRLGTTRVTKDKRGEILFEKEDIKKRWAEYIEELFHDDRGKKADIVGYEELEILQSDVETALNRDQMA